MGGGECTLPNMGRGNVGRGIVGGGEGESRREMTGVGRNVWSGWKCRGLGIFTCDGCERDPYLCVPPRHRAPELSGS